MNEIHRTTFVFATHDPDVLSFAKREIRIHDGRIESDKSAHTRVAPKKRGRKK
jgi:ABC-type lipoprotein export system ATPase subunit